ncbi:conjugal transfer protein TraC, partial [Escherichia coli]
MTTTEHPVRQLLWCALNALKTAQENHNITSETGLRHYLLEWLSGASRHPEFRSLPGEIMALKALTEKDRNIPIIGTLNTLFLSSATVGECPLFRFRAALGKLQKAGWRTYVCPWPERVFNESIERACSGKRHLLQLSRTEECFLPTGDMRAPVTLQLITPLHRKTMQLLEAAELIFSDEGFQVVRGYEHQFGIERRETLFHTLFIGLPSLPEDVWGATQ